MEPGSHTAPTDRYCDLVMKGGITSGIVYPPLVAQLAQHYRFKNIGGTSAGAIAAAVTAAAEFDRRRTGSAAAFETLKDLPAELGEKLSEGGKTKLFSLFQPSPGCHRLFRVLTNSLNAKGTWHRIGAVVFGLLLGYWLATLAAVVVGIYVWAVYGLHAGWLTGVAVAMLLIGCGLAWDVFKELPKNWYGMCSGMQGPPSATETWLSKLPVPWQPQAPTEALTPWLHGQIQDLAGLPVDGPPLTFGQLWSVEGFPPPWLKPPPDTTIRSIDLRMFTTNLSTGRPFIFPLTGETCRLFYLPEELEPLLPEPVYNWLVAHSKDYLPDPDRPGSDPPPERAPKGLKELPEARDFPILLAARMSLSFPLLFSAVPLWAIDYDPKQPDRTFERCMLSDGGISSNFPVHMFDGLLPLWPTFGVQLEPKVSTRNNMVYLPREYMKGYGERWDRFASKAGGASRMGGFIAAIVSTMQNWNDNTSSRMPGVRDRVVRVRLGEKDGGMNLNMEPDTIEKVAARGKQAAQELIDRYVGSPNEPGPSQGWNDQRWIRFATSLSMLEKRFFGVELALGDGHPHGQDYLAIIEGGADRVLPGEKAVLTPEQIAALKECIAAMRAFNTSMRDAYRHIDFEAIPETDLRIRPSL
ncbi:patatin-like phospholipase family protein [Hydrogenophaga crassostreae]|nr:patatin-like phospholipase family protein [Hydrogenophaga crassostreae]